MANPMERVQSDFMESREEPLSTNSQKKPETLQDKIVKLVKSAIGWVPLILMMALPKYAGYAVGYACALGWSFLLLGYQYYCYRTGSIKIFPKILDIGMSCISFCLLITEVSAHPGDYFHYFIAGILVNSALSGIVLISILIGNPFTLQFAKETIPQDKWNNPQVLLACNATAVLWLGIFILTVISQIIPLAMGVSVDSTIELVFGTIGPIAIIVVGFKLSDELLKFFKEKQKEKQKQQEQGVNI